MPRVLMAVAVRVRVAVLEIWRHVHSQIPNPLRAAGLADDQLDGDQVADVVVLPCPDNQRQHFTLSYRNRRRSHLRRTAQLVLALP